jgi:cyclomaltodextrinase
MKHPFPFWILIVVVGLWSCNSADQQPTKGKDRPAPASIGLFSPIQLGYDSTEIFLEDYFPNGEWPDSIRMDQRLTWKADSARKIIIVGRTEDHHPWLSTLDLWFGKYPYNILVRKAREVHHPITFDPQGKTYQKVQIAGEINGWNPDMNPMVFRDGKWEADLILNPGRYQYQIVVDGKWMLDPANPSKVDNNMGGWNSEMEVGKGMGRAVERPLLRWRDAGVTGIVVRGQDGDSLMELGHANIIALWENQRIPLVPEPMESAIYQKIKVPEEAQSKARSHLRVYAQTKTFWTNDILIPLDHGKPLRNTSDNAQLGPQANTIYFILVDRFANGNPANDAPLKDPRVDYRADFHGGDLAGITQKLKEGYFDSLGINMLWISPIVQNPEGAYQEYPAPRRWFSGYHGYWPVSSMHVDHRFGTDQELKNMVKEAHAHGIKVILDYVANHLHEEHPMIKAHPEWKTELYLKDSVLNVRLWDTHRIGTWFDLFMPSLDYSRPEVVEFQSDSALYWVKEFGLDGFRQDATKHIPTPFWRRLTQKLKQQYMIPEGQELYQIGETFGSRELIGSYVGSGLLDAQFDFNYYWTLRGVFSGSEKNLLRLPESMAASESAYGSHSLMGNITGNHDMPRFIAYAGEAITQKEDPKEAGWTREVKLSNMDGYKRLQLLHAWLLMGPGVPVMYYGDEIGMVGAGDPDNRRDMKFAGLTAEEAETKRIVTKLAGIRKRSLAVLYGSTEVWVQGNMVAMKREYGDSPLWLVVNLGKAEGKFQFPEDVDIAYLLKVGGPHFETGKVQDGEMGPTITLPGLSFEVIEGWF